LNTEIEKRKAAGKIYAEKDLWYILFAIVSALAQFQHFQIYHGDIKPINIFVTTEGFIKVADQGFLTLGETAYSKVFANREKGYLSPAQLNDLSKKQDRPSENAWKSDVYALGMTMLQAATIIADDEVMNDCYNWDKKIINSNRIEERFKIAESSYSPAFLDMIKTMLDNDEMVRPDFMQIYSLLAPYVSRSSMNNSSKPINSPFREESPGMSQIKRNSAQTKPQLHSPQIDSSSNTAIDDNQFQRCFSWLDSATFFKYKNFLLNVASKISNRKYVALPSKEELERCLEYLKTENRYFENAEEEKIRIINFLKTYDRIE
jgi:serine/threonine protein kinase